MFVTKRPSWLLSEKTPKSASVGDILGALVTQWEDTPSPSSLSSLRSTPVLSEPWCTEPIWYRKAKAESLLTLVVNDRQLGDLRRPQRAGWVLLPKATSLSWDLSVTCSSSLCFPGPRHSSTRHQNHIPQSNCQSLSFTEHIETEVILGPRNVEHGRQKSVPQTLCLMRRCPRGPSKHSIPCAHSLLCL